MATQNYYPINNFILKGKIFSRKKSFRKHYCFYSDIDLSKENIVILNEYDILLCVDELSTEETKEYKSHLHYERKIKILYRSNIFYLPVTIVYSKATKKYYLEDFNIH